MENNGIVWNNFSLCKKLNISFKTLHIEMFTITIKEGNVSHCTLVWSILVAVKYFRKNIFISSCKQFSKIQF